MIIKFGMEETKNLKINTIALLGSFNQYNPSKGEMKKEGNEWTLDVPLEPGEYFYKFLINKEIKLNDQKANMYRLDSHNETWSAIVINEKNERLYNNSTYTVHLEDYNISNKVCEVQTRENKKNFTLSEDKKVVTRFEFTNVTGLHSVTAIWYDPYGGVFGISESTLFTPEGQGDKPIMTWFLLDLQSNIDIYPEGLWAIKLFIDGIFVLEDRFNIQRMNICVKNTREYLI